MASRFSEYYIYLQHRNYRHANVVLRSDTELDQLLKPLMPKIFQSASIIILAIKVSELFLGQSAAALAGLLGGAGLSL